MYCRQRLELFCQACEVVQHAHKKGIIQRDIKPWNVVVTVRGDKAVPQKPPRSETLHLPPGYSRERDGALPQFVWAYPIEFKSADAAGQVMDSPYRSPRVNCGSPLYWLTEGYAIMENATMPIVGEGKVEPNDSYVEQLVASAQAAVDEAVRRGVADPNRAAIGGHSYGAFMTANLLAHSDIFRAGIARSGAFNRTLTPFGFQSEQLIPSRSWGRASWR